MKTRKLLKYHQKIGLMSVIVVILLSITGILLNHTEELSLKKQSVNSHFIQNWYGIELPKKSQVFKLGEDWVSVYGNHTWVNQTQLNDSKTTCAANIPIGYFLCSETHGLLYTEQWELIDRISYPAEKQAPKLFNQSPQLTISFADNTQWQLNEEFTQLQQVSNLTSQDFSQVTLPKEIEKQIEAHYQSNGINWERLLLDLHSGRFFGSLGVWIIDLFAILFVVLGITGIWIWQKQTAKKSRTNYK